MVTQPMNNGLSKLCRNTGVKLHDQMRFAKNFGELPRRQRPSIEFTEVDNQRRVTVLDVAPRALAIAAIGHDAELVLQWDGPILGLAPARCPASVRVTVLDSKIQRTAICAGLPS